MGDHLRTELEWGRHLGLVGPTASGKSALALALAAAWPGTEIVSVDSMAVYREMDIATAKPSGDDRRRFRHHMIDVADPGEIYGVARYQCEGRRVLADIERRGARAVLVGGTGLYLRALVDGLQIPGQWPRVAEELQAEAARPGGLGRLYGQLVELDPTAADRIERANARRLIRALEVTLGSGRAFSSFGDGLRQYAPSRLTMVGVPFERETVDRRIGERLAAWMDRGLLDEVRALARRSGGLSRTARQALAYRELLAHVETDVPLAECLAAAEARTRSLARRQWSWFRRDPRVQWLEPGGDMLAQATAAWKRTGSICQSSGEAARVGE